MSSPLLPLVAMDPRVEICILAGGLSSRMGRDKARLRLGRRTLLGLVRANASELNIPMRVVRKDLVARCGPLGGIYSALKTTRKDAILFLSCDMPFVSAGLLRSFVEKFDWKHPLFAVASDIPGFPAILPKALLSTIRQLIEDRNLSIRNLVSVTHARLLPLSAEAVFNINTPQDLVLAKKRLISAQDQLVKKR
jgi:molybdopterin-guanine dinucleotide biosynthesis protein A